MDDSENNHVVLTLLQYVAVNAEYVLSSPTFLETPVATVQVLLDYSGLAIEEDVLLLHILRYSAHVSGAESDFPALWSPEELEAVTHVLKKLIPRLCILSLSPTIFIDIVEPLTIFSTQVLLAKYKYDALLNEAVSSGRSEREMVLEMYGGSSLLCGLPDERPRARASFAITESAHPYEVGGDEELELVSVAGWAGRMMVEFDKRSCVAEDAQLSFYADANGKNLLGDWKSLWGPRGSSAGSRKFVVFPGNQFWVGFKCPARTRSAAWGWKLRARPIYEEDDK